MMKLKAKIHTKTNHVSGNLYRNVTYIHIIGEGLTHTISIYAQDHNQPNTPKQLEFANAIMDKINEGQEEETGEAKLFIKTN